MRTKQLSRRLIAGILIGTIVMAIVVLLPFTDILELKSLDLRFQIRGSIPVSDPIIIVSIDDASFVDLKRRWPWPRTYLAQAIDYIVGGEAKAIGLDVAMSDQGYNEEEDEALVEALKRARNVILPIKFGVYKESTFTQTYLDLPLSNFRGDFIKEGFVNLLLDRDSFVRSLKLFHTYQDDYFYPFYLSVLARYLGEEVSIKDDHSISIGDLYIPPHRNDILTINYSGPSSSFPTIPFYQVMRGTVSQDTFKDKIVLIGAGYPESHDLFPTPFFDGDGMYGIEIHANAINTVLSRAFITKMGWLGSIVFLLVVTFASILLLINLKPYKGLVLTIGLIIILSVMIFVIFITYSWWVRMTEPLIALGLNYTGAVLYRYLLEEREKRKVRSFFSRYVSPSVVDKVLDESEQLSLGGETKTVTIFFSDIRGFTTISENMTPPEVVEMLNEYFQEMVEIVFKYEGTVNKFIGDAIMAIFGAPINQEDAPERALRACLEMREKLKELNEKWRNNGKNPIRIGMGVHMGDVVVGNVGSSRQMEYTVIGDAVNVSSRIESLTKEIKTDILISDDVYFQVKDLVEVESPDPVPVKGKSEPLQVHKVLGYKEREEFQ